MNYFSSSSHMENVLEPDKRRETIGWILGELKDKVNQFDAIAVRGYSMALIAPTIADKLRKNLILVRKPGDNTHSGLVVEGPRDGRYIIIDDVINSGNTIKTTIEIVKKTHCVHSKCVGVLLFHHKRAIWYNHKPINSIYDYDIYQICFGDKSES